MSTQDTCGSTDTADGSPCGFPSADNCPHHSSGLSAPKRKAADLLSEGKHRRKDIAKACGVTPRTLRNWTSKHPELADAAEAGDIAQFEEIRDAWFRRLVNGEHSASEIIFYMKNKSRLIDGENWRDTHEIEHSGEVSHDHEHDIDPDRISDALAALAGEAGRSANGDTPDQGGSMELGEGDTGRRDSTPSRLQ